MDSQTMMLIVLPLLLLQTGLIIYALYDIYRNQGVRPPLPTWAWVVIIVFGELFGSVLYFIFGRREDV